MSHDPDNNPDDYDPTGIGVQTPDTGAIEMSDDLKTTTLREEIANGALVRTDHLEPVPDPVPEKPPGDCMRMAVEGYDATASASFKRRYLVELEITDEQALYIYERVPKTSRHLLEALQQKEGSLAAKLLALSWCAKALEDDASQIVGL